MIKTRSLNEIKSQHARLLAALLACDNPDSDRARELRGMMRELERDMKSLEQTRIMEMAARLKAPEEGQS